MNNKMLISTAMLNAYWENEKKDTLDLLVPFVKYSIAKTTDIHSTVNIPKVTSFFKSEFGYDTIPANVITLILKRMSPSVLTKQKGNYILNVSLDEDIQKFEKGHACFMEHCSKVATSLKDFLNDTLMSRSSYNEERALKALIEFWQ